MPEAETNPTARPTLATARPTLATVSAAALAACAGQPTTITRIVTLDGDSAQRYLVAEAIIRTALGLSEEDASRHLLQGGAERELVRIGHAIEAMKEKHS